MNFFNGLLGPDTNPQTTVQTYYSTDFSGGNGLVGGSVIPLKSVIHPDGSWEYYEYDDLGRLEVAYAGLGNQSAPVSAPDPGSGRRTDYYYGAVYVSGSGDDGSLETRTPRMVVEYLLGQEISRRYAVIKSGEKRDIRCQTADVDFGWEATDNLITITKYFTSGDNNGRVQSVENPDGTMQIHTYDLNGAEDTRTNIVKFGQPNGGKTDIADGTKSITVIGSVGEIICRTNLDIASGIVLSSENYSYNDEFKRSYTVTYLDGTSSTVSYGCCGLESITDRDGVTTIYFHDALKRQVATSRLNITLTNVLDAAGNVLERRRIPSSGSPVTLWQAAYDLAGRITSETNALDGVTAYTNITDGSGQTVKTNIYPDSGVRIEIHSRDGSLAKIIGNAARAVRYEYGVEQDAGVYRSYTKEIKLDASGNDTSEWTKTYTDMLGRAYKTVYPAASGSPASQSLYNNQGQLWKQVDPDGVVALYQYNGVGEIAYTAVDLNRNDTIDFNGTDRIMFKTNWVEALSGIWTGINARVQRTYAWNTDNSSVSNLLSSSYDSTDGLQSWQGIQQSPTISATTFSRTVYSGINRYVTNTAADNSYTVSHFQNGRLLSVTRRDSGHNQIAKTTYGYDAHGRQSTVTDARNGTTTYTYNDADLVASVTTPNPGTLGGAALTTSTYYNQMLQATSVLQPDGTSVIHEYHLTGELKKTYGARAYPVEYTYDYAGRMKTMKTWKDFGGDSGTATTSWYYHLYRGWLTNKVYADGKGPIYSNTPAGRLALRIWARGTNTTYSYNNAGDLSGVDYSDSTPDVTYGYDRRGRQNSITANSITTALAYNDAGQLLSESYTGGTLAGLSVTNGYDPYLRRTNLTALNSPTVLATAAYGYDNASRLQTVSEGTDNATYSYLVNSPLVSQIVFKENSTTRMTTTKSYDYLNRLLSISSAASGAGQAPGSFAYTYNSASQRTRVTLADGSYWLYDYDTLGQVRNGRKYWSDGTPMAGQQFEYAHDDIGNRASTKAGGDENGWNLRPASYAANNLNQYTSRDVPGYADIKGLALATNAVTVNSLSTYRKGEYFRKELTVDNSAAAVWQSVSVAATGETTVNGNVFVPETPEAFTYDEDGNLTGDGRWTYEWDGENRLRIMRSLSGSPAPEHRLVFEYDWKGRRIGKTVYDDRDDGQGSEVSDTIYLYDGWNVISELDANAGNAKLRSYLWGLDLSGGIQGAGGVGGLVGVDDAANGAHFCAYDGNGNVMALVKASDGTVSANCEYGPFGELIRATGLMAKANPFRFSTKYQDDESDLLYYGYRFYNQSLGRWLSRDPLQERGGVNLYCFVGNSTPSAIDFRGLQGTIPGGPHPFLPFDMKHPPHDSGCSFGKCCWENARNLARLAMAAEYRRNVDFTEEFLKKALDRVVKDVATGETFLDSWNGHRQQLLDQLRGAGHCARILAAQIASNQCFPWTPEYQLQLQEWQARLQKLTDPGEVKTVTVGSGAATVIVVTGVGIILATLIEDLFTGGIGVADDPVTVAAGAAAIRAGCKCFSTGIRAVLVAP